MPALRSVTLQMTGRTRRRPRRHAANLRAVGGHSKINNKRAGQRPVNRKLTACRRPKKNRDLVSNGRTRADLCPYPYGLLILILGPLSGLRVECTHMPKFDTLGICVLSRMRTV